MASLPIRAGDIDADAFVYPCFDRNHCRFAGHFIGRLGPTCARPREARARKTCRAQTCDAQARRSPRRGARWAARRKTGRCGPAWRCGMPQRHEF